jgi:hypothetical protein
MITTFQALAVAALALLPGAAYTFAYEREAGAYGIALSDRLVRFLAASAVMHALLSGCSYWLYRHAIHNGDLAAGKTPLAAVQAVSMAYVALPTLVGLTLGTAKKKGKRWAALLIGDAPEPRAWDYLWSGSPVGLVRARLKSGSWIGGYFASDADGRRSYASGYPEPADLYIARRGELDQSTGTFAVDDDGHALLFPTGLLVRWDEIEVLDITHDLVAAEGEPR